MAGIRNRYATPPRQKEAILPEDLIAMPETLERGNEVAMTPAATSAGISFYILRALPRCLVGMEACSTSHYWARELGRLGFEVKLMRHRM